MFPYLYGNENDPYAITTFSFMLMVASPTATFYAYWLAPKKNLSQTAVLDLGIVGTLGGIVGGRLFHTIVEAPDYYWHADWEHLKHIFEVWKGGFVSYGAIIMIGVSWFVYLKLRKLPIMKYLDLVALICPIIIFFVRVGCLGAGCCYGKPTNFFLHITMHGVQRHPTQIYAILNAALLFGFLHLLDRRKKFDGQIIWSFLTGYGFLRSLEELTRGDADRGLYWGNIISTGQIMSVIAISFGTLMYLYCYRRYKRSLS